MYIDSNTSMFATAFSGVPKSFLPKKQSETPVTSPLNDVEAQSKNDVLYGVDMGNNMMAGNFVNANRQPSKYVQAAMEGMQQLRDMRVRQSAILDAGILAGESAAATYSNRYAERILEGQKAARKLEDEKSTAINENSEDVLDKNVDDIEEKAEEATNPTDENGNPIPKDESGNRVPTDDQGNPVPETDTTAPPTNQSPDAGDSQPALSLSPSVTQTGSTAVADSQGVSLVQVPAKGSSVDMLV